MYFHDVGLAAYLLGIENAAQIETHPLRGALFENMVIAEVLKHRYNSGRRSNLNFYRDSSGLEIDLVYPLANRYLAIEIKAGQTVTASQIVALEKFHSLFPHQHETSILVYGGEEEVARGWTQGIPLGGLAGGVGEPGDEGG